MPLQIFDEAAQALAREFRVMSGHFWIGLNARNWTCR